MRNVLAGFIGGASEVTMPDAVLSLQTALNRAAPDRPPLKVDGVFGDRTRARLRGLVAQGGAQSILDARPIDAFAPF